MASSLVSDENYQRKLQDSSANDNMNSSSEECEKPLSNSSESRDICGGKSPKKNNSTNVPLCDKQSPKDNLTTSNGTKLFPIFAVSSPSRPQLNSSVNEEMNGEKRNDNARISSKITLLNDETKIIETKDNCVNETAKPTLKKGKKSYKNNSLSKVTENSGELSFEQSINNNNALNEKASTKAMKVINPDGNVPRAVKRKRTTSAKQTDVSEKIDKTPDEQSSPKVATVKKQSITEFFQKIPNVQDNKTREGIPKLFSIFSNSQQKQKTTPNSSPSTDPQKEQKKLKIDEQVDGSVDPMKISIDDAETSLVMESENSSDRQASIVSTPVKKVRTLSQKGRKTFGAAVLRSCNSKSICPAKSNDELDDSTHSEMSVDDDILKAGLEKKTGKKVETNILKMFPQNQKSLKSTKDRNTLKLTIKSADKSSKLFPLFLKSPAALAKKKSIKLVNSLAKKKGEIGCNSKLANEFVSDSAAKVVKIKKKRGRPRRVENSTLIDSTETEDKQEELPIHERERVSNNDKEKIKRKVGRPKKVHSSITSPLKNSVEFKEIQEILINEEEGEISKPDTAFEISGQIRRKAGRPRKLSSALSGKKTYSEVKEIQEELPVENSEIILISDNVTGASENIKRKSGRPRKILDTIVSSEKDDIAKKLLNKAIEVDVVSEGLTVETETVIRKSLRLKSVQSSVSSKKRSTDVEEALEELSNESIEVLNDQKKKNPQILKGRNVLAASRIKGQPPPKKQKMLSLKKSALEIPIKSTEKLNFGKKKISIEDEIVMNTDSKELKQNSGITRRKQHSTSTPVKVLTEAETVMELSDESIEEIIHTETLSKKVIQLNSDNIFNNSSNINNVHATVGFKKLDVPLKKIEKLFTFPLYSHCGQIKSLETKVNSTVNFTIKEDETFDNIPVPLWHDIIGLTEVKTIEPSALINNVNLTSHTISPSSDSDADTLWTNIANDYNLKEGISESTISELGSWLKQWKLKFTKNTRQKRDKDDSFDSYSCDSYDSDEDGLSNSVILTGPPGSGKTSLVFSLASEHGFKVLEVNASSCRSGRNISHQLKEALESYHVENTKTTDVKVVDVEEGNYSRVKSKASKDVSSKKTASKGIASFFQKEKSQSITPKHGNDVQSVKSFFQPKSSTTKPKLQNKSEITDEKNKQSSSKNVQVSKDSSSCSISSHTIILFDDVDVVFQEDEGFWSTIRGFLKISKKPVIFTVSRNLEVVKANLDVNIQILHLKPMINEIAIQKLEEQFKKHNRKNTNLNIKLLAANSNDVRRNLLHAQFWSQLENNQKKRYGEKPLSTNTFVLGSLDSSAADFNSFILDQPSSNTCNLISDYHRIGYDILHANLFSIFNVSHDQEAERKWQVVTKRSEELEKSESDPKPDTANGIPPTDLWQEACKIFEFKKRALKSGSASKDLFMFSNILEDFSFVDNLKGHYCKNTNWTSLPERLKKWTLGLPVCNDDKLACPSDFTLDASSTIQVLRLKEAHKLYSQRCTDKTVPLFLEHPFPNFDNINGHKTEEHIEVIASAAPANVSVNKSVLNLDYLSTLKIMGHDELLRQSKTGKRSNRFLHYFDSISLFLDRHQIEQILQR